MSEQVVESCELGLSVCSAAHAAEVGDWNKNVFKERLKAGVEHTNLSSVGSQFNARGTATENALSLNFRRVLRIAKSRSRWDLGRPGSVTDTDTEYRGISKYRYRPSSRLR